MGFLKLTTQIYTVPDELQPEKLTVRTFPAVEHVLTDSVPIVAEQSLAGEEIEIIGVEDSIPSMLYQAGKVN